MTLNVKVFTNGFITPSGFVKYANGIQDKVKKAYAQALKKGADEVKKEVRNRVPFSFKLRNVNFPGSMRYSIYDKKKDKLNSAIFYVNKNPYFIIHETGGIVTGGKGMLFIPFNYVSRGRNASKAFFQKMKQMKDEKKTFVRKVNGRLIVFLKIDRENQRMFRKIKTNYKTRNNLKKVSYGTNIPVGVLMPAVTLKRRFDFENYISSRMPAAVTESFDDIIKFDN